jgi:hypothetical protein
MSQHPLFLSASRLGSAVSLHKQLLALTRASMHRSRGSLNLHKSSSNWLRNRANSTKQDPEQVTSMVESSPVKHERITSTSKSHSNSSGSSSGTSSSIGTSSSSSTSFGSSRLTLLLALIAVATVILASSGGFGGLKDRVKVSNDTCINVTKTWQSRQLLLVAS